MPFAKLDPAPYPRRLWGLYGFPGCGKSTFAARMRGPILVIDADHRFDEVAQMCAAGVYALSDRPADNVQPEAIAAALRANMPGSDVRTVVIDSLTAILAPLVTQALLDNDAGRNKNKMTAFIDKALALRLLQDAVTAWGTDVLFVYHLQTGRNEAAEKVTTTTVSRTELARLTRSLNMQLRVVEEGGRHGVRVDWARRGRSGVTLWDDTGAWVGMPEKIETSVYDGLSEADQRKIEAETPISFTAPAAALAWGFERGAFQDAAHAHNAYDKLKADHKPTTAPEMWSLWIADVLARVAAKTPAEEKDF
jgi:hypothetical protein